MSDIAFIEQKINELLLIVNELEEHFAGRKFTLDGHLFGSLGEAIAEHYYGIELVRNNTPTYDGVKDGKQIQIKITQGSSVDINKVPEYLLVLFLHKQDRKVYEVYNGPCDWLNNCKKTNNGWYNRTLNTLSDIDKGIRDEDRLESTCRIDKWHRGIKNI